ncbi:MAG: polyisoprenoid-binding protein [Burkholderiaceae bacterium]|nr:polyisoprenoid-binding protein [Burkholderiaceae bacterium]
MEERRRHRRASWIGWFAAVVGVPAAAQPVAYQLDPTHSFATFEILHFDTSTIRGRFGPLSGDVQVDRAARKGRVQVVIATAEVSTGLPALDSRLRREDLLAVAAYPQAYFVAERFEFGPDGAVTAVGGVLTLRGVGQGLRLNAQRFRCYTNPLLRREVCGGDFEAELSRSAFGIHFGDPFVGDTVRLKVAVEAIRQEP